jgi:transposase
LEVVKSYKIPVEAPKDLIEACFEVRKRALEAILSKIKLSLAYGGRLMKCEKCSLTMDRDVVAVLNIQMRGAGLPQRALKREGLSRGNEIPPIST